MQNVFKFIICFLMLKTQVIRVSYSGSVVHAHVKYFVRPIWIYIYTIIFSPVLILIGGIPNVIERFRKDHPLRFAIGYHQINLARHQKLSMWDCYIVF
jgi:hypothetical protein